MINSQLYSQHDQTFYFLISFLELKYSCVYMLSEKSLCGAIGQRVRLLTERLMVQIHPGTCLASLHYIIKPEESCPAKTQSNHISMSEMQFLLRFNVKPKKAYEIAGFTQVFLYKPYVFLLDAFSYQITLTQSFMQIHDYRTNRYFQVIDKFHAVVIQSKENEPKFQRKNENSLQTL